ncbi:MAG: tetratricopeptide repeat protein [FCB group bacterium]|nr:tetratricopeptide repeat protein [FCB group bacterium]
MTEKNCSECGEKLSAKSAICSACGYDNGLSSKPLGRRVNDHFIIIVVLVVALAALLVYQSTSKDQAVTGDPHQPPADPMGYENNMADFVNSLPTDYKALVSMGNALMDQSNFAMAVECYERAVEQQPGNPDVLTDLGACWHALGNDAKAIAAFGQALEYDPKHSVAKFNMGIVYLNRGDSALARHWWGKLLEENPPAELRERIQSIMP